MTTADAGASVQPRSRPFHVALDLEGRDALVVGGDDEGLRRTRALIRAGARVLVVAPGTVVPDLAELEASGAITIVRRAPSEADMDGKAIAVISTADEAHAPAIVARARRTGQPICTVDRPEHATFSHPAVLEVGAPHARDPQVTPGVTIAISTGGTSPLLARRIREDLEAIFADPRFAALCAKLAEERARTPRGERAAVAAERLSGFAIEGRLRLPAWCCADATDEPPKV